MRRISHILRRLYHEIRHGEPVWFGVLNRGARRFWRRHAPPNASEENNRVFRALAHEGIAISHIDRFPDLYAQFALMQRYAEQALLSPDIQREIAQKKEVRFGKKGEKTFFVYLLGGDKNNFAVDFENPFTGFSLSDSLIGIVGSYLKLAPKFNSFYLMSTIVVPPDSPAYLSQRWHRDPEDKKLVKIFLYLNDVDEGTGPFTYVKGSQYGGRWRRAFPQRPPAGSYPPDGAVEKIVPAADVVRCTGRAGTMIFCDTSGLHKGGFSTEKSRLMSMASFVSAASRYPINYERPNDFSNLSILQKYALRP